MWIVTRHGFVSLVAHKKDPALIRARARRREHLADTFGLPDDYDIIDYGPGASDYRWHADIPVRFVANAMSEAVYDIDYKSHAKEAMAGDDQVMYRALLSTWAALHPLQDDPRGTA